MNIKNIHIKYKIRYHRPFAKPAVKTRWEKRCWPKPKTGTLFGRTSAENYVQLTKLWAANTSKNCKTAFFVELSCKRKPCSLQVKYKMNFSNVRTNLPKNCNILLTKCQIRVVAEASFSYKYNRIMCLVCNVLLCIFILLSNSLILITFWKSSQLRKKGLSTSYLFCLFLIS